MTKTRQAEGQAFHDLLVNLASFKRSLYAACHFELASYSKPRDMATFLSAIQWAAGIGQAAHELTEQISG